MIEFLELLTSHLNDVCLTQTLITGTTNRPVNNWTIQEYKALGFQYYCAHLNSEPNI